ncbi:MAG: metalloregulator ArsR/SmtB family transcription factor [Actinomycetota bacterium]|nr:metalloregulator ArsR/SmtB family transcription factor [Actinomycetota bacterium]
MVAPTTSPKTSLYDGFAQTGQALASGRRVEILDVLAQGERSVEGLAASTGLSLANCSRHLQVLKQAGLVSRRRQGVQVYYRLASAKVLTLLNLLRQVAHDHSAQVRALAQEYLGGEAEPVTREELLALLREGRVEVIDVRPQEEYRAGHLSGARSIPIEQLEARLAEVRDDREVVAYCRGRFCAYAHQAVRLLERAGRRARRLEDGLPEWGLAGLPVESER